MLEDEYNFCFAKRGSKKCFCGMDFFRGFVKEKVSLHGTVTFFNIEHGVYIDQPLWDSSFVLFYIACS